MKGDRLAGKFFCPRCLSEEKVWETGPNRVVCASCGRVVGWYEKREKARR